MGVAETIKQEYDTFTYELSQIQHDAVKIGGKIDKIEAQLKHIESELINVSADIKRYYDDEEKIEQNNKLNDRIDILTGKISKYAGLTSLEVMRSS